MADFCASGTINVVFHGTCLFVKGNDGFQIMIPEVSDHDYVAGTYGQEVELNKGMTYTLNGIVPDSNSPLISRANNICITDMSTVAAATPGNLLFCQWNLPWPERFHSIRDVSIPQNVFTLTDDTKQHISPPSRLALVHVLSYRFDHLLDLRIVDNSGAGFNWKPNFLLDHKCVNLHVYADPKPLSREAEKGVAFLKVTGLFDSLNISLIPPDPTEKFVRPPDEYPEIPGLEDANELQNYQARNNNGQTHFPYSCAPAILSSASASDLYV